MKSLSTLSKPISSPGRADKFPPPLMRFLRTNAASRSRKSSTRASPIFYLRSRKNARGNKIIEAPQEPTSPKVTCIGQVRVRRSNKKKTAKNAAKKKNWRCFKKPLFFLEKKLNLFSPTSKTAPFRRVLRKWGLCFRCKKVDTSEEGSFRVCCDDEKGVKNGVLECVGGVSVIDESLGAKVQENKRDFSSSSSSSPPKNALLLTRCRSAPYRSSSLGGIFWGSPLKTGENETGENEEELQRNVVVEEEESRISEEELKGTAGGALHPLLLTRCKSEPARTGERLVVSVGAEASFWKQRRFDGNVVQSFSDHSS